MAYMSIIDETCARPDCAARATRRISASDFSRTSIYCTRHAAEALIAQERIDVQREREILAEAAAAKEAAK